MKVFVPKEVYPLEKRIPMTLESVAELVGKGRTRIKSNAEPIQTSSKWRLVHEN